MTHVLFPGSFDPVTIGHMDLITRASRMFDTVTVAVLHNNAKQSTFTLQERVQMLEIATSALDNVQIDAFEGLTVRYAQKIGANVLLRGLRSATDLDYEKIIAATNRSLAPEIETVFLLTDPAYGHVSSSMVKELAGYGADFSKMVPSCLVDYLQRRFQSQYDDQSDQ